MRLAADRLRRGQARPCPGGVFEDRHGRCHASKAKTLLEGLRARHRVQNDLAVRRTQANQPSNDFFAKSLPLVARPHGDIAEVGTVAVVGQGAAGPDKNARVEREGAKHAVCEHQFKIGRRLVAERSGAEERGEFVPIDAVN